MSLLKFSSIFSGPCGFKVVIGPRVRVKRYPLHLISGSVASIQSLCTSKLEFPGIILFLYLYFYTCMFHQCKSILKRKEMSLACLNK